MQQSAEAQYSRLEELTSRLEALNPGLQGGATRGILGAPLKSSPGNDSVAQQQVCKQI